MVADDEMLPNCRTDLVFAVNGEKYSLSNCNPSTTLLQFLRSSTRFKSPKRGCGEGGCGACVVLLSRYDPVHDEVEDLVVSSCLTLLCSINGCSITTAEGIGNSKDGFHPIQQRIAGFHASQCGFCTPGVCMSLFGALVRASKSDMPDPPAGFSNLTVAEAERSVAGNLCRCTGYRPIVDACKSFAADVDIEDLGFNSFWRKGDSADLMLKNLPFYGNHKVIPTFPQFLKHEFRSSWCFGNGRSIWYRPSSLGHFSNVLEYRELKFVAGNTGLGYKTEPRKHSIFVDLRFVPQLTMIGKDDEGFILGAAVTISRAIKALKEDVDENLPSECRMVFRKVANHLEKIANEFVRNTGTVGGNLVMAQTQQFPSDIATILLGICSTVEILSSGNLQKLTLEEFLEMPPLDSKTILVSVKLPFQKDIKQILSEKDGRLLFETYRAAPRPLGNALSYLNAAFLAVVSRSESDSRFVVHRCRLAFGAYGTKHAIRAKEVEAYLNKKLLTLDILYEALNILKVNIIPDTGVPNPAYRTSLATGFLFEFLAPLVDSLSFTRHSLDGYNSLAWNNSYNQSESRFPTLLQTSKQDLQISREYYSVGEPLTKLGAAVQASGEAVYVDDIPSPVNCLYGSFIYSTKPYAKVKGVGFPSGILPEGVTALLSFKDIPQSGANVGSLTIFGTEPLFADDFTRHAGERLALVVADSQENADLASNLAVVVYDDEDLEPPILTVDEAVKKSSYFDIPSVIDPKGVGDVSNGMAEAEHKILSAEIALGSQYYFYMENQTAMAVPDEDNGIVVYTSTQCPENVQAVVANCLGIPQNNVRVITRRVGGGFGGKAIKSIPVAAACALAGHKLGRPVRMYLDRKTDMIMAGGRHPMKITFDAGFKSNGKVTALRLKILINGGISPDISPVLPINMAGALKKYHWGALALDIRVCKTNHCSKSAMRAPGELQGSHIVDTVIEHVASALSMDVDVVKGVNLHSYDTLKHYYGFSAGEASEYTLPTMWDKLAASSCLHQRKSLIEEFNRCNLWRKRGISRIPIVHEVTVRPTPGKVSILSDGSVAVEVGGIELGQGLWTKAKQMAAFGLSLLNCEGEIFDRIRVIQADTLSLIQGGFTSGSTTSEASCEAVRLCCEALVDRLQPVKNRLQPERGSVTWEALITQAYREAVNMSASCYFVPASTSTRYLNFGAAVSEVEINLLTGESTILRSDILYDCGQSLNPAVDMGQIEGAFVQGIGFFMIEEYTTNSDGLVVADGTWTYKIPTLDTIPRQFNVETFSSGHNAKRVLSSKASGEPPLLLAGSVHSAAIAAIRAAHKQLKSWGCSDDNLRSPVKLEVPATMAAIKEISGLDVVERYLDFIKHGKPNST